MLELLDRVDADNIYLIGDIIDGHRLRHERFWPQTHEQVLDRVHEKARQGSKVTYIVGNHDEGLREWLSGRNIALDSPEHGLHYRGIIYKPMDIHTDAKGQRHLVIHTDQFDSSATRWFYGIGDRLYDALAWSNRQINHVREALGMSYWSFSGVGKRVAKRAIGTVNRVDHKIVAAAKHYNTAGVIGGHTHDAVDEVISGIQVRNDGDMVDSISALIEDHAGNMRLLDWAPFVHDYKSRLRGNQAHPQAAFAPLAHKFGAQPVADAAAPEFNAIGSSRTHVSSRYAEIIDLATYGADRLSLPMHRAVSTRPIL